MSVSPIAGLSIDDVVTDPKVKLVALKVAFFVNIFVLAMFVLIAKTYLYVKSSLDGADQKVKQCVS